MVGRSSPHLPEAPGGFVAARLTEALYLKIACRTITIIAVVVLLLDVLVLHGGDPMIPH